jgi:uncharacterized protein
MTNESTAKKAVSRDGFHVMAKPSGPACNLDCTYCFYLEKEALFDTKKQRRMPPEVLEAYIRNTIESSSPSSPVTFTWQGGEPTLLGLDFYKRALALQKAFGSGREIHNSFQTNGTLLDDDWAQFFADKSFLIGLSLDGPANVHDHFRRYRSGAPSHHLVMQALERLQRLGVAFNVLTCVDRNSSQHALETYRFHKAHGISFIQYIPIVERLATKDYAAAGFDLDGPGGEGAVAPFAVEPLAWGKYLSAIFEEWRRHDVGDVYVMNFEWSLAAYMGKPGVVCVHQENCGRAVITEHNGDVYSCDHFVYPEYKLGNLTSDSLAVMVDSARQTAFGRAKSETLPAQCRKCRYLGGCWGGCPKHRFTKTPEGESGLNYLCAGYLHYLQHVTPFLKLIAELIQAGRQPEEIMAMTIVVNKR